MPDPLATTVPADASADAPVTLDPAIEKIIEARLEALVAPRIAGFQRLVSAREEELTALRGELENERLAGLPEDERADILEQAKDKQIRDLEAQNELLRLGPDYGNELPYFQRLLGAESAKDQLDIMREHAAAQLAIAHPEPDPKVVPEVVVPDVDLNRPPPRTHQGGTILADGTLMTEDAADRILSAHAGTMASTTQQRLRPSD